MYRYMGLIVKRARKEKSLSQKALIDQIGCHKVSLRTLRRIEDGLVVRECLANEVLNFLNIKLKYYLHDEYEHLILERCLSDHGISIHECIQSFEQEILVYRLFSPSPARYPISNLLDFLIYLPLINPSALAESLYRIGGNCQKCRFNYVLDQMSVLYKLIPDSSLKKTADALTKNIWDEKVIIQTEHLQAYQDLIRENASHQ